MSDEDDQGYEFIDQRGDDTNTSSITSSGYLNVSSFDGAEDNSSNTDSSDESTSTSTTTTNNNTSTPNTTETLLSTSSSSTSTSSIPTSTSTSTSTSNTNEVPLTERQNEALVLLQTITGSEDINQCRMFLENHNWDLEAATQTALLMADEGGFQRAFSNARSAVNPTSASASATAAAVNNYSDFNFESSSDFQSSYSNLNNRNNNNVDYSDFAHFHAQAFDSDHGGALRNRTTATNSNSRSRPFSSSTTARNGGYGNSVANRNNANGLYGYLWYPYNLLSQIIGASVNYLGYWIPALAPPPPHNPLTDVANLEIHIEALYGRVHPGFFQGSYNQAIEHSKRELKYLLVYIHSPHHVNTPSFCRNILCSDEFSQFVDNNFIFWAGNLQCLEGFQVSNQLEAATYPFLGLIAPLQQPVLVDRIEGVHSIDYLITRLNNVLDATGSEVVAAREERHMRTVDQQIREEQDAAYTASLRADQEKERKKQEELERQRAAEEEEQRQQKVLEELAKERANERERKKAFFTTEPDASKGAVARIALRLPNGQRLDRKFYQTDTLQTVYDYVDIQGLYDNFSLTTSYPARTLEDLSQTLIEAKLVPSAMLLVQNNDA